MIRKRRVFANGAARTQRDRPCGVSPNPSRKASRLSDQTSAENGPSRAVCLAKGRPLIALNLNDQNYR